MKKLTSILFVVLSTSIFAQINILNTKTPEELVQEVLLGTGVTVSNIRFNNSIVEAGQIKTAAGEFTGTSIVGINSGVILSCGNIAEAVGPNASTSSGNNDGVDDYTSDTDLQSLQTGGTAIHDGVVLEFDFVPSGDSISFEYVFASEEYPEFAPPNNSSYNDAFGFFLTGNNPDGGTYTSENIATLSDGTIVSINNINPQDNNSFYQDNAGGTDLEYDGLTTILTAAAKVNCGETYHIKLAISDAGDRSYNSAIFLEANSFSSNAVQVAVATVTGDSTLIEGCANAEIIFSRPESDTTEELTIHYDIEGSAENGVDYTEIADSVTFGVGEDTVTIILSPIDDGIEDSPESVIITAYTVNSCGDTITSTGTVWIFDPNVIVNVNDSIFPCPLNDSILLVAEVEVGVEPYSYLWNNGETNDSIWVPVSSVGTESYIIEVTDGCSYTGKDTAEVTVQPYNASFSATPLTGESPLVVNYTNTSPAGQNYNWIFGDGNTNNVTDLSPQTNTFQDEGTYYTSLYMSNSLGCLDSVWVEIIVVNQPEIEIPNVFTPNGDNHNDVFKFISHQNISQIEFIIKNRWGNVVYEITDVNAEWDGRTKAGNELAEGTYFYYFQASSPVGTEISGQGFIQLKRN